GAACPAAPPRLAQRVARALAQSAQEADPPADHPVAETAALGFSSRSRQFVHSLAHLPDQVAQASPLGLRLLGIEPAAPFPVALASRCPRRLAAVRFAFAIRHGRGLTDRSASCPGAAPSGQTRRLKPAQPDGIARLIYRFVDHPPASVVTGPAIAPTMA